MKNQQQGSRTDRVRQTPRVFPDPTTVETPFTPPEDPTACYLALAHTALESAARVSSQASAPPSGQAEPTTALGVRKKMTDRAARFAAMGAAALSAKPSAATGNGAGALPAAGHGATLGTELPRMRSFQEINAELQGNREERRRKQQEARREAEATLADHKLPESHRAAYSAGARVVIGPTRHGPDPLAALPDLEKLLDLVALCPKRGRGAKTEGAGKLARLLDELARHILKARRYRLAPSQIVFHSSQELLAAELGVDVATVRRWTRQLEALGYCDSRPHFSDMTRDGETMTAADGLLFAVRLTPGYRAHLTYDDLSHQWRDLDADRKAGRTAWAILEAVRKAKEAERAKAVQDGEKNCAGQLPPDTGGAYLAHLKDWAVTPGTTNPPLLTDPRNIQPDEPQTVQDVVYALPLVLDVHPTKRPALVGLLGSALARNLNDQHSRRWYCRIIWDAYHATIEGRQGLQALAAQLARLDADRHEWAGLRNPAALLVARLRYPPPVQA